MPAHVLPLAVACPPFDPAAAPETIVLTADRSRLRLEWSNGERAEVLAENLRGACRCAWCTRARIDGNLAAPINAVAIDRLMPIGDYAINIAFSDGHARGIYPWPYLRLLARADQVSESAPDARAPAAPHDGPPA
jgi:prepilin-type processing-associated H-X9-DG protein